MVLDADAKRSLWLKNRSNVLFIRMHEQKHAELTQYYLSQPSNSVYSDGYRRRVRAEAEAIKALKVDHLNDFATCKAQAVGEWNIANPDHILDDVIVKGVRRPRRASGNGPGPSKVRFTGDEVDSMIADNYRWIQKTRGHK